MAANICFTTVLCVVSAWYSFQEQSMLRELEAINYLYDHEKTAWSLTDSNGRTRTAYDTPDDLQWNFSRWDHGRNYPAIVWAFIPSDSVDLDTWNRVLSFRYLESLWLQECQLASDIRFSSLRNLRNLEISDTLLSLQQVRSIADLVGLEELTIENASDNWLEYIARLTNLRKLSISGLNLSDGGLAKLITLKELHGLGIEGPKITSKSASWISCCKKLEWLCLAGTKMDDLGLKQLAHLTELKVLRLDDTKITDQGLVWLAQLPNLEDLWLTNTDITDAGVRHLSVLKRLRHLELSGTRVTNKSVDILVGMPLLKPSKYSVKNTKIDQIGLERWQAGHLCSSLLVP